MLFNTKSMNAEASLAHRSEHEQIPKPELPHEACTYNFLHLEIERASGVIYSSCHRVFSLSPSWCHHDSSWIRLDCDYGTFSGRGGDGGEMLCVSCTVFAEEKIELSRMLSDMTAKTRGVHGNNNWVSCENVPLWEELSTKYFTIESMELDGSLCTATIWYCQP